MTSTTEPSDTGLCGICIPDDFNAGCATPLDCAGRIWEQSPPSSTPAQTDEDGQPPLPVPVTPDLLERISARLHHL